MVLACITKAISKSSGKHVHAHILDGAFTIIHEAWTLTQKNTLICNSAQGRNYQNEPWHEISNNLVCATSKGSDQPAHTRRLIRAFACRLNIQ